MEAHIEEAISLVEQGIYDIAQIEAEKAEALALQLRDVEMIYKSDRIINYAISILYGDGYIDTGRYDKALESYLFSLNMAQSIENLNTEHLERKIAETEMYIAFFALIEKAKEIAEKSEFNAAISIYEEAKSIASALSFTDGNNLAEAGIEEMHHQIILAKRAEAENLFMQGEAFYQNEQYEKALIYYNEALEIYIEIDDRQIISFVNTRIVYAEQKLMEEAVQTPPVTDDTQSGSEGQSSLEGQSDADADSEVLSNFHHNLSIDFDLETKIDNQNRRPANRIRMGSRDGMNEGWYNGCGWVAVYNALIILGDPKHPAEIVRFFEESGGTVMGGMFGTYPNAIEAYLKSLGYSVDQTIFPQLTKNIDDEIKNSRAAILAYAHTSAAHYVTIEYIEDIDKFIVYNDSFARTRSAALGFESYTSLGAAIDSVSALISGTRDILFSFSLIVVR